MVHNLLLTALAVLAVSAGMIFSVIGFFFVYGKWPLIRARLGLPPRAERSNSTPSDQDPPFRPRNLQVDHADHATVDMSDAESFEEIPMSVVRTLSNRSMASDSTLVVPTVGLTSTAALNAPALSPTANVVVVGENSPRSVDAGRQARRCSSLATLNESICSSLRSFSQSSFAQSLRDLPRALSDAVIQGGAYGGFYVGGSMPFVVHPAMCADGTIRSGSWSTSDIRPRTPSPTADEPDIVEDPAMSSTRERRLRRSATNLAVAGPDVLAGGRRAGGPDPDDGDNDDDDDDDAIAWEVDANDAVEEMLENQSPASSDTLAEDGGQGFRRRRPPGRQRSLPVLHRRQSRHDRRGFAPGAAARDSRGNSLADGELPFYSIDAELPKYTSAVRSLGPQWNHSSLDMTDDDGSSQLGQSASVPSSPSTPQEESGAQTGLLLHFRGQAASAEFSEAPSMDAPPEYPCRDASCQEDVTRSSASEADVGPALSADDVVASTVATSATAATSSTSNSSIPMDIGPSSVLLQSIPASQTRRSPSPPPPPSVLPFVSTDHVAASA
ncbi:unnamed protein product [Parajaminaea phylloscopi]